MGGLPVAAANLRHDQHQAVGFELLVAPARGAQQLGAPQFKIGEVVGVVDAPLAVGFLVAHANFDFVFDQHGQQSIGESDPGRQAGAAALTKAGEEDPSLQVRHAGSGETLIEGQGEMHLRVALERLSRKYGIAVRSGPPAIAYKETIKGSASIRGRHKKQSGGHGQFGDVVIDIKPLPRGSGFQFAETIVGGAVPRNYIPSVELGVSEYLARGPLGFPVVDIAVTLTDGSYHAVDSSDMAFRTAAQIAMREGMPQCRPVLLEPVDKVEIFVPSEATAKANAIVSQRRGQLLGFDARPGWPGWDTVQALIPEAEIGDLIVELRSATSGVGTFRRSFDHLAEISGRLADLAIEKAAKRAA